MHKEEMEKVQREVSQDVSQEVRNWRIAYKEKREKEFQAGCENLGLSPSDLIVAPGGTASPGRPLPRPPSSSMGPPPAPRAGSKRTASGNSVPGARAHTPAQTASSDQQDNSTPAYNTCSRSRSRTPSGPRASPTDTSRSTESTQPALFKNPWARQALQQALGSQPPSTARGPRTQPPAPAGTTVTAMEVDPEQGNTNTNTPPQLDLQPPVTTAVVPSKELSDGGLATIQSMLTTLAAWIEQVASMVQAPRDPGNTRTGRPPRAPKVDIPRAGTDNGPTQGAPPHGAWNVITTEGIAQQRETNTWPADTRGPSNTEVTVLRDGGLLPEAAKAAMRAQQPDTIVKEVQRQINAKVKNNPLQLLAGRWSSSVKRMGNFIFTIRRRVDFPLIASYSRFLLAPFPGAELTPTGNWTWVQLRGVPIWGDDSRPHPQDELLATLRTNPAFENAILTITPRWQVPLERLNGDTGTVLISYSDPDGAISRQEPWYSKIGTTRNNQAHDGVDVLRAAANPKWDIIYPATRAPGECVKVVTYIRLTEIDAGRRNSRISATCRMDLCAHPCVQLLDFCTGKEKWRVLNFYNDICDLSALDTLTVLDLDPTIPTLLVGDFNTHSPSWSLPGWDKSPHADRLENWLASQTFSLLSEPEIPTLLQFGNARPGRLERHKNAPPLAHKRGGRPVHLNIGFINYQICISIRRLLFRYKTDEIPSIPFIVFLLFRIHPCCTPFIICVSLEINIQLCLLSISSALKLSSHKAIFLSPYSLALLAVSRVLLEDYSLSRILSPTNRRHFGIARRD
ncbi:hypothetical protein EI94DRAFT_1831353 [Lactarius quietus]|nr:hypothetical protein EI94DRAFT_1831353 [Lactarius quietus]